MKTLHFQLANNLSLLHDELLTAIPSLRPVPDPNQAGENQAVMQIQGRENDIWLTVPNGADEAAINTVVQAHNSTKLQADPHRDRLTRIGELLDIPRSNWTTAQLRELLQLTAENLMK